MAIQIICDRCETEITEVFYRASFEYRHGGVPVCDGNFDLCKECYDALQKMIHNPPIHNPPPETKRRS